MRRTNSWLHLSWKCQPRPWITPRWVEVKTQQVFLICAGVMAMWKTGELWQAPPHFTVSQGTDIVWFSSVRKKSLASASWCALQTGRMQPLFFQVISQGLLVRGGIAKPSLNSSAPCLSNFLSISQRELRYKYKKTLDHFGEMTPRCTTQLEMFIELWAVKCLESANKGLYKYLTKSYKPVSSHSILPFLGHEFWLLKIPWPIFLMLLQGNQLSGVGLNTQ